MNQISLILIAMFAVYGFYAALCEIRGWLRRIARRYGEKIDKQAQIEYNKKNE